MACAESRREMEDWIGALRMAANRDFYQQGETSHVEMMSGHHNWYACSHARPTYCNVCREALAGVTSHGLSCEVCKFKAHKRCAVRAPTHCKWTSLSSIGQDILEDEQGIWQPHQWLEGNLPVSAKCQVCEKTCGSVLRLQDFRCLWCRAMLHASCKEQFPTRCPLGQCRLSVLPPTAITTIDSDGYWEGTRPPGTSPLLVYVNTKSGDNQGVKFLRRFKQLLNPAQVFDLMNGGPYPGLKLFQRFDSFRILICGGDGSIGWVLAEIDRLDLHKQCQVGVLPFGTGNDLARVLGWGAAFDDDTQLPAALERLEHAQIKMLDRWSIWSYEGDMPTPPKLDIQPEVCQMLGQYEDSVANNLAKILQSDDHQVVISSARVLCETVKALVDRVGKSHDQEEKSQGDGIGSKFDQLNQKLQSLMDTLDQEAKATQMRDFKAAPTITTTATTTTATATSGTSSTPTSSTIPSPDNNEGNRLSHTSTQVFKSREALMSRANSLKKAVRKIIEHTERAVDEQNAQTDLMSLPPQTDRPLSATPMARLAKTSQASRSAPSFSVFSQEVGSATDPAPSSDTAAHNATLGSPRRNANAKNTNANNDDNDAKEKDKDTAQAQCDSNKACSSTSLHSDSLRTATECPRSPASRRISSMSTFIRSSSLDSKLANALGDQAQQQQHHQLQQQSLHQASLPQLRLPYWGTSTLPGVSSSIAKSLASQGFVSKVLMANADALCAAASPLLEQDIPIESYQERCVMNNYFGIGLDAKITLAFQNKREEHPEKCRSRTKNLMWYGVLGGKEMLHQNFKNLDQRVLLECDGHRIPLPSLQGIVVLNIPSYGGGANFWGGSKQDENFSAPSFDDRILEVVAVFGGMQMAMARLIDLQHHRIAQCRSVKFTILGQEGVPVQVDGEAWLQPPGYLRILHKNRAQMLIRDRSFESVLKSWSERSKPDRPPSPSSLLPLSQGEVAALTPFLQSASRVLALLQVVRREGEKEKGEPLSLPGLVSGAKGLWELLDKLWPLGKGEEPMSRTQVTQLAAGARRFYTEATNFILHRPDSHTLSETLEDELTSGLVAMETDLRVLVGATGMVGLEAPDQVSLQDHLKKRQERSGKVKARDRLNPNLPPAFAIRSWSLDQVGQWLSTLSLAHYKEAFRRHEIHGAELMDLERRDLKDMGVTKVGHLKRLQEAIKELHLREAAYDRPSS